MCRKKKKPVIGKWTWGFFAVLAALAGAASILGFFGRAWWPLELLSHFRVQYIFYLATLTCMFLAGRRFRYAALAAIFMAINAITVVPLYVSPSQNAPAQDRFRALLINVYTQNPHQDRVVG